MNERFQIKGTESLGELLDIVCHLNEFRVFEIRPSQRKALSELGDNERRDVEGGKSKLRFPVVAPVSAIPMKISWLVLWLYGALALCNCATNVPLSNCSLLQATLGNVIIGDVILAQETAKIHHLALRLVRYVYEYLRMRAIDDRERCLSALVHALTLLKSLEVRMWENSQQVLSQLPKIGAASVKSLMANGVRTFEELAGINPRDIERILKRSPPFGDEILQMIQRLPMFHLTLQRVADGEATDFLMDDESNCNDHHERADASESTDAVDVGTGIKVNVKHFNRDLEHNNLNGEITLIVGDLRTNQVLFYEQNL